MPTDRAAVIRVLGDPRRLAGLNRHLPASWSVLPARSPEEVEAGDVVLLIRPHMADVAAVSLGLPAQSTLVVLLDRFSPALDVAVSLETGADRCVREGSLALLAAHLTAGRRRLAVSVAAG